MRMSLTNNQVCHVLTFIQQHPKEKFIASSEELVKHFQKVYNGAMPPAKKISEILGYLYRENKLRRKSVYINGKWSFNHSRGRKAFTYWLKE